MLGDSKYSISIPYKTLSHENVFTSGLGLKTSWPRLILYFNSIEIIFKF